VPDPPPRRSPTRPAEAEPVSEPPAAAQTELGWYVYGIAREGYEPPPLTGVDGEHRLAAIGAEGGLGALASQVPLSEYGEEPLRELLGDVHWIEPNARRHEHVLEQLRADGADVVPMRLCTIYRTSESVREALVREHEFLLDALDRLAGRTEWGVKAFLASGVSDPAAEPDGGERADEEQGPGASYLLERRQAGRRAREQERLLAERCEQVHARLCAAAVEGRLNPLQPPELSGHEGTMLLNGVYLVANQDGERFAAEVERLAGEQQELELVLTGPWPPYNFVGPPEEQAG
jgi:hypothetical protein